MGKTFWTPSYFLATVGDVSLDTLINYVNTQRTESGDDEEEQYKDEFEWLTEVLYGKH